MTTQQEQSKFLENKDNTTIISPKQPHFNDCCCCSLRTGNLVFGWTLTVLSALLLITCIVFLCITISASPRNEDNVVKIIVYGVQIFATLVAIALYSLILIGVHKKKPNCLKAFVIIMSIFVNISFIAQVRQIFMEGFILQNVITAVIYIGMNILAILYVNSYRIQLIEELGGYSQQINFTA